MHILHKAPPNSLIGWKMPNFKYVEKRYLYYKHFDGNKPFFYLEEWVFLEALPSLHKFDYI